IPVLRLFELGTHERGTFQTHLHRRMTVGFQPVHQSGDLRGTARAVCALDDDQPAREFRELNAGDAVSVEPAALVCGFRICLHAAVSSSISMALSSGGAGGGNGSGLRRLNCFKSMRSPTSLRTSTCCLSTCRLASMTTKLNSPLIAM